MSHFEFKKCPMSCHYFILVMSMGPVSHVDFKKRSRAMIMFYSLYITGESLRLVGLFLYGIINRHVLIIYKGPVELWRPTP